VARTVLSPGHPTWGHAVGDDEEGTVMRYLDETDEAPTRIVKLIGDLCGILIYTGIVGLLIYAVLR
jgi:predicted signal transduction protein with EAL and GGDEF domain